MSAWKYYVWVNPYFMTEMIERLGALGEAGWELVSVSEERRGGNGPLCHVFIFKQPLEDYHARTAAT